MSTARVLKLDHARRAPKPEAPVVEIYADAKIPTRRGELRVVVFHNNQDDKEHVALIVGELTDHPGVLVRLHSECMTSEVFGSLKCDCREQLDAALDRVFDEGQGIVLYLRQEGRGIGLGNKIRAYELQAQGLDTVEANIALGFHDDLRRYDVAAGMLRALNIDHVRLLTNNPKKVAGLEENGIHVDARVPHEARPNQYNQSYLKTKRDKSGHLISVHSLLSMVPV
jgi:GTP cyclohydrolase II/3,4-dihydroxy 2-butanone 4-phosphate synthase/GTP cyclohydrolase II